MAAQSFTPHQKYATQVPAESSVLASGTWYKIKVFRDGIYRLTYEDILNMGFSDPSGVRIFGNGGAMLPLVNSTPRYDDLIENAIYMDKGTDNVFNQGDYILFYCHGPVTWTYNSTSGMFEHQLNQYSDAAYYFVTTQAGEGKRITMRLSIPGAPTAEINSFTDYSYHEKNKINLLKSGREWFGEKIDHTPFDTTFVFSGVVTDSMAKIKVNVVSRSVYNKVFTLSNNTNPIGSIQVDRIFVEDKFGIYAKQNSAVFTFHMPDDRLHLSISYTATSTDDIAYLDYITCNVQRQLSISGDALVFRDKSNIGSGIIARYSIANANEETQVWDITNHFDISQVPAQLTGSVLAFSDSTRVLKEYVALNKGAAFPKPEINADSKDIGPVLNQNLHGAASHQMLIVTHPLFLEAADSIAEFHRMHDNMSVLVTTTEQVYNEFSSGAPDVSAIRDFAKLVYNRAQTESEKIKYLLLLGDGSYNNISQTTGNVNYILTYQSENSLNVTGSYVSDDFFGLMEPSEGGTGDMERFTLDLGVGRLPVKTADEAMAVYQKIRHYNTVKNKGDWQNNIMFVADDQDGNIHMQQANDLADWVDENYPQFVIKKVMLDAYPQQSTTTGTSYPDVNRIIANGIEKGMLIFNYTGHGGEQGLADEHILMREDIEKLNNIDHLPLFVTATCEFSRFDDLTRDVDGVLTESTSAGELSLLNPHGGSIALLTTTRLAYSTQNSQLNTNFFQVVFNRNADGKFYSLGDIVEMTKNALPNDANKLNFILLGDPALKLAIPNYSVVTDSVNHVAVSDPLDTLKAFSGIIVSGHIEDYYGNFMDSYTGYIAPSVFDKNKWVTTLANDNGSTPMQFGTREDLLFKGKASVTGGRFTFKFIVPKDITYSFGKGRITYFANDQETDAHGQFSDFIVGGTNYAASNDSQGPDIELYMNDELFNNEGITNPDPLIYAKISDKSGINTIGNGIGHDITGIIDGNQNLPIILNDYFVANLDDNTSGLLTYQMQNLTEGMHSLRVKVWDVYNNSSDKTIEFRVMPGNRIIISKAFNFPNPAIDHTSFTFEHNRPGENLSMTINIYDLQGRLITDIHENFNTSGFNFTEPEWDLKDANGNLLKQGVYLYRIRLADNTGSYTDSYQKLVVIR